MTNESKGSNLAEQIRLEAKKKKISAEIERVTGQKATPELIDAILKAAEEGVDEIEIETT